MIAIDEDILQGLEFPTGSLLHAEGYLIVDVIVEVIVVSDGLGDLVAEENCGFEDTEDVGVEVGESHPALLGFFVGVYEEDQHASIFIIG